MKIAQITGSVTATAKDPKLSGVTFLLANIIDGQRKVLESSVVLADTCSAGVGDVVLIVAGSAARLPAKVGGLPVDAATVAVVDHIDIQESARRPPSTSKRSK